MAEPVRIESYVEGRWVPGEGEGSTLVNPATGEALATASTAGIDLGAALRHAREVGGPALRALTFAQRAALLKALAGIVRTHRDELLELCDEQRRQHQGRRQVRRRRRERHAGLLRQPRPRARRRPLPSRRRDGAARPRHAVRRPPRVGAAPRRRGARQRLQLPGLGVRREGGVRAARRHAGGGQAGDADGARRLAHRAAVRRGRGAAGGELDLPRRAGGRPARPPRGAGRARLHRLSGDRREAARASARAGEGSARQRRGRLAQRRRARARRRAGLADVGALRQGSGARDDAEGGAEVHGDAPRLRAAAAARGGARGARRAAGRRCASAIRSPRASAWGRW